MPVYDVLIVAEAEAWITVDADSEHEAFEKLERMADNEALYDEVEAQGGFAIDYKSPYPYRGY